MLCSNIKLNVIVIIIIHLNYISVLQQHFYLLTTFLSILIEHLLLYDLIHYEP